MNKRADSAADKPPPEGCVADRRLDGRRQSTTPWTVSKRPILTCAGRAPSTGSGQALRPRSGQALRLRSGQASDSLARGRRHHPLSRDERPGGSLHPRAYLSQYSINNPFWSHGARSAPRAGWAASSLSTADDHSQHPRTVPQIALGQLSWPLERRIHSHSLASVRFLAPLLQPPPRTSPER